LIISAFEKGEPDIKQKALAAPPVKRVALESLDEPPVKRSSTSVDKLAGSSSSQQRFNEVGH